MAVVATRKPRRHLVRVVGRRHALAAILLMLAAGLLVAQPGLGTLYDYGEGSPARGRLLWLAGQPVLALHTSRCTLAVGVPNDDVPLLHHGDRILADWCPQFPHHLEIHFDGRTILDWRTYKSDTVRGEGFLHG